MILLLLGLHNVTHHNASQRKERLSPCGTVVLSLTLWSILNLIRGLHFFSTGLRVHLARLLSGMSPYSPNSRPPLSPSRMSPTGQSEKPLVDGVYLSDCHESELGRSERVLFSNSREWQPQEIAANVQPRSDGPGCFPRVSGPLCCLFVYPEATSST